MRDRHDRARILVEMVLQPGDRLGVKMVGRLVEQQQVGRLEEQAAEDDAAALSARERGDVCVTGWEAQRVHGHLEFRAEVPRTRRFDLVL